MTYIFYALGGLGVAFFLSKKLRLPFDSDIDFSGNNSQEQGDPSEYGGHKPVQPYIVSNENLPRGVRNNNPLNIEFNSRNNWIGQTGSDGRFAIFSDAKYGIRAGAIVLRNYQKAGYDTVYKMINRWAPNHENPTNKYSEYVAKSIGINQHQPVMLYQFPEMIKAMIYFENGSNPYSEKMVREAIALAN